MAQANYFRQGDAALVLGGKVLPASGTQAAAITALVVTPTAGSLPTANGAITIANTGTPTVVELLEYCTELKSQLDALLLACKNVGVTL